jgi:hypothetical protein
MFAFALSTLDEFVCNVGDIMQLSAPFITLHVFLFYLSWALFLILYAMLFHIEIFSKII